MLICSMERKSLLYGPHNVCSDSWELSIHKQVRIFPEMIHP